MANTIDHPHRRKNTRKVFSDFFVDQATGGYSATKIWSHIGKAVATYVIITMTNNGNEINDTFLLVYMGVLGTESLLSKLISYKFANTVNPVVMDQPPSVDKNLELPPQPKV